MRLHKIRFSNIYSLRTAALTCDRQLTVIVGPNDAGKSNILRAINLASGQTPTVQFDSEKRCQFGDSDPKLEFDFLTGPTDQNSLAEFFSPGSVPTSPFHLHVECQNDSLTIDTGGGK